ncbi:uncharacterized protein [Coffea arabica]|uniref:Uncharacterized protein n=1 Tax=Coffea arabica TaxID=13443 RepID=A0A6P6SI43_COFAR|nr:uncharacterized protein LOC113691311 [Coffea arabica]
MESIPGEPQINHQFKHLIGQNHEIALSQSIQTLLDSLHGSNFEKLSLLSADFKILLQCKTNPSLETIWVYSALAFHHLNSSKNEPLNQFAAIKDLFQLIISYSAGCSSLKSIILMSPVIYHVHKFAVDSKGYDLRSKKGKKLMKEIKGLVDSILGYINVCCEALEDDSDGLEGLIKPFEDLVSIWIWNENKKDRLRLFFPLLGEDFVEKSSVGGCELNELAGYVIAEVFLLKLCLAFRCGNSGKELQNELRNWVVGSITGLQNSYFFDSLLRMLLGPTLPVTFLLISEDEKSLRKLLYEPVILVEYSFLSPDRLAHLPANHAKNIALGRLMVTHEAIEFFRKHGDHTKALSCTNAFSTSSLPSELTKWVRSEIDVNDNNNGPNGSSPKAFLRWILDRENQGIQIFDNDMSSYHAKLILDNSEEDFNLSVYKENKKTDADLFFYIDNKGDAENEVKKDEKMTEAVSAAFVAAAQSLQSAEHGERKRKGGNMKKNNRLKFLKYDLYEGSAPSAAKPAVVDDNGLSSGSDVENPSSDEDEN